MREKRFLRLTALVLCLATVFAGMTVFASAAGSDTESSAGSITDTSREDILELLNTISYSAYCEKYENVGRGEGIISVDIADFVSENSNVKMTEDNGFKGLYTPQDGDVTWTIDLPEAGKYTIKIEYYPNQNRTTSIERALYINDEVPFAEARYLTLAKNWTNAYEDAVLVPEGKDTLENIKKLAAEHGFKNVSIQTLTKNGTDYEGVVIPFVGNETMTADMTEFCETYNVRFFVTDIHNNELRPVASEEPTLMTYYVKDSTGYYSENFEFAFKQGENTLKLEGKNEPMTIKSITLLPLEETPSYEEYLEKRGLEHAITGKDFIKIEGEFPTAMSNKTIYPVEERSCAINSPSSSERVLLNTIGGEKWATAGQWVEYSFSVETPGMYDIVTRFRQNVLDGMYTCRSFYIYSDDSLVEGDAGYYDGVPFEEALKTVYNYNADWQVTALSAGEKYDSNGDGEINGDDEYITYPIYLDSDVVYTIRYEVTLGKMGDIVREVEDILNHVNNDYLEIIKLTGTTPDKYRDYGFRNIMLATLKDMVRQSIRLETLAEQLTEIAGEKSSNVGTLQKISILLEEMGTDDDEIAKNLSQLKSHIGTLGTFLSDVRTQPLQIDYIAVQPAKSELPAAKPSFFQSFGHEIASFFQSFFRDYNALGTLNETGEDACQVWVATGRDQSQVIRNLVNSDFSPNTDIAVDLKLVAGGTLLPSILAGSGPDVYLGLDASSVINYAIRSALINVEEMDGFEEFTEENFNEAAMFVLGLEDADENMHYYGLPETQSFQMMFVRNDILAELGLDIPKTWDDVEACVPVLQANNMQIGLPTDYNIFLYQNGGSLFADDGMRINLGSSLGGAAFEKMCNFFTMYSYPYSYNAANRFRTGEMPIVIGDYTSTYNTLKVFATEIEGMWSFYPLPGERDADGNINNVSVSGVTASVMVKGCDGEQAQKNAWEFMKWYTGTDTQISYANEMVAILGPSAKHQTANKLALESLPWTTDEARQVRYQFNNLASIPNYPGTYIIARYTNFAFLSAYNDKVDPVDAINEYIATIDKEIARKRDEFNLETLAEGDEDYKDLTTKRLAQLEKLVGYIKENKDYSSKYASVVAKVEQAVKSEDLAYIISAQEAVQQLYEELDPNGDKFVADRTKVMGYDMTDKTLTKAEKKTLRKCFSYELYSHTDSIITQFKCCSEFLSDVARLMNQN